ncbi:MAG: hypothetical protein K2W96_10155 [Gemmataceae bacterium]|nr:hypothetical protein [Gemmataceae bacterium]
MDTTRIFRAPRATPRLVTGDRLAIVGPSGAGKTALLRRLGEELGAEPLAGDSPWLDGESTGWEAIRQRLGQGPAAEAASAFCGLGDFLDLPVRCYSTGMRWRLGFALATASPPEVLLCDRAMWGGDLAFRERARQRIERLAARSRVAALVSGDTAWLERHCNRAVWLDEGEVVREGRAGEVLRAYRAARFAAVA